jgi:hypothetical protein
MPAAAPGVAGDLLDLVASDGLAGKGGEQLDEARVRHLQGHAAHAGRAIERDVLRRVTWVELGPGGKAGAQQRVARDGGGRTGQPAAGDAFCVPGWARRRRLAGFLARIPWRPSWPGPGRVFLVSSEGARLAWNCLSAWCYLGWVRD